MRKSNLDILRLFLALEVVYFHCRILAGGVGFAWRPVDAVPAFVCLSGFLIPGSFRSSRNGGHFAWKRLLRVGPAFLVSLLLVVALFGPAELLPTLAVYVSMGFLQLATGHNGVLWSLALEEVLYASHAFVQIRKCWNPWTVAGCTIGLSALYVGLHCAEKPDHIQALILRAAPAYFVGNLAYFWKEKLASVMPLGIVAGLALMIGASYGVGMYSNAQALLVPAISLAVMALALNAPQVRFEIPDLSYGIYIYHLPIAVWLTSRGIAPLSVLTVVVPFAYLSTRFIEQPVLKWKDRLPSRKTREARVLKPAVA